jgi:UDP-hydrolysing UDP-N-acetyl-D-glucosamine 2-epimerase
MAGALAAVTTGRLLTHIHGGDLAPGDIDDSLRHAITKLAHLHLAATRSAKRRIIRMGEPADRVHWVGAPGLDHLAELTSNSKQDGLHRSSTPRALILHHPCGRSPAYERRVMATVLRAVDECGLVFTCIYPNSDRGHSGIIEAIEAHRRRTGRARFDVVRSLDRDTYLRHLIEADLLVGNSSSGIIEAATAGTPSVNIGPRQDGREPSGSAVVNAGETRGSIRAAIRRALRKRPIMGRSTVYGHGTAGGRIAALLADVPLSDVFRRKANAY